MTSFGNYSDVLTAMWGERPDSSAQVAARVDRMLCRLVLLDSRFEHFHHHEKGRFKGKPLPRGDLSLLQKFIECGRNRDEEPPYEPIVQFGFCMGGWNKERGSREIGWRWNVGHLPPVHYPETVRLEWPPDSDLLTNRALLIEIIEAVVDAWEPDTLSVAPRSDPKGRENWIVTNPFIPTVGWMLYLAGRKIDQSEVPSAFEVRPCGAGRPDGVPGTLVITREQQIDFDVKADFAHAEKVRKELGLPYPSHYDRPPRRKASKRQKAKKKPTKKAAKPKRRSS